MRPRITSDSLSLIFEVEEMGVSFSRKDISHNKKDLPESKYEFAEGYSGIFLSRSVWVPNSGLRELFFYRYL